MTSNDKYQHIRPLLPEEIAGTISELLGNESLREHYNLLGVEPSWEALPSLLGGCKSVEDFKERFSYHLVQHVIRRTTQGVTISGCDRLKAEKPYTYISNHRDIILDSAFLNVLLLDERFLYPQVAIGDNLMVLPWVEPLVKLNGSFLVRRSLVGREFLLASKLLSEYMHDAIRLGHSLWIAQREGRAKDSDDRTQPALLKMLSLGVERGTPPLEALTALNIIPTALSYEYDPCDYLKAREMQLKRDDPTYQKTKADDALNMSTGVFGHKGRVHIALGRPLEDVLSDYPLDPSSPLDLFAQIGERMDREIHSLYKLYPINYIALDLLNEESKHQDRYSEQDQHAFETYIDERISLVRMPEGFVPDQAYLRQRLLEMYANPTANYLQSISSSLKI